jgi:hypothetical protein
MRQGAHRSVVFTPPATAVRETREADHAQAVVEADPADAILLYGHMLADVGIVTGELGTLLFGPIDEYRSKLRVIRSASKRLSERAGKLLGEE